MSRGVQRNLTRRVHLRFAPEADKQAAYARSLRDLLADQIAFIRDPSHRRRITEQNGLDALILAETAANLAAGRSQGGSRQ